MATLQFIMPDGRKLTQLFEHEDQLDRAARARKGSTKEHNKTARRRAAFTLEPQSEYEAAEFAAASKLGSRRLGRWLNDRLLRRLAGPMTAQDMASLFSPPPFGEHKQSALQSAIQAAPELWARLRNVDMDKEATMLQKWQEHNDGLKRASPSQQSQQRETAASAERAWHRIGRKGRNVLLAMDLETLFSFEDQILAFMHSGEGEMHVTAEDSFDRCALHALADFHGLHSTSVDTPNGRSVRLRTTPNAAPPRTASPSTSAAPSACTSCSTPAGAHTTDAAGDAPGGTGNAGGGIDAHECSRSLEPELSAQVVERSSAAVGAGEGGVLDGVQGLGQLLALPFTVVDIVMVLKEQEERQRERQGGGDGGPEGRPTGSLGPPTLAIALVAHRREHLPADLASLS